MDLPSLLPDRLLSPAGHLAALTGSDDLTAPRRDSAVYGNGSAVFEQQLSSGSQGGASSARRRRREPPAPAPPDDDALRLVSTSSGNELINSDAKRVKLANSSYENGDLKSEVEADSGVAIKVAEQNPPPNEAPKQDYIHVRARRGQATDSHSLAERARREKISERMKILQDLVPGCNKVIGKASVLDEIINYIQALQRQVEFLSMKLEAVNSHMSSGIEGYQTKDFAALTYDTAPTSTTLDPQSSSEYGQGSAAEWLHMQIGGAYGRVT